MGTLARLGWTLLDYGRHAAGQVATSVVAALCVAAVTQAMMKRDVAAPAAPVQTAAPSNPAPASPLPPASTLVRAPSAFGGLSGGPLPAFAVSGVVALPLPLEHAFPLDGDPVFQASLSRPFLALAGSGWSEPATVVDGPETAARRKPRTLVAETQAAGNAPVVVTPTVAASAPATPEASSRAGETALSHGLRPPGLIPVAAAAAAPAAPEAERRLFGIRMPSLPSVPDLIGGVAASAGALTRFANLP